MLLLPLDTASATSHGQVSIADLDPKEHLNAKHHRNHILFSGTRVLQHTGDKNSRIRCVAKGWLVVCMRMMV